MIEQLGNFTENGNATYTYNQNETFEICVTYNEEGKFGEYAHNK